MAEKRRKPAPVSPCHCLGWDIPSLILCHSQTGTHPASFPGRPACGRQVVEPLRSSFLHLRAWCAVVDMLSQCKQQEPHSHRLDQHPDFPWHTLGRPEHRGAQRRGRRWRVCEADSVSSHCFFFAVAWSCPLRSFHGCRQPWEPREVLLTFGGSKDNSTEVLPVSQTMPGVAVTCPEPGNHHQVL